MKYDTYLAFCRTYLAPLLIGFLCVSCQAQSTKPNASTSPHFESAVQLERSGNVDGAIAEYRLAIRDTPSEADAHYNLGRLLEMQKHDHDRAIEQFRAAMHLRPDDPDVHNSLGLALKNKGDLADAGREYREALRISPTNAEAHVNLGNIYYLQKHGDAAAAEYRAAIADDSSNSAAHLSLANVLDDSGHTDAAIAEYKIALRLQPDNANTHYNLAISLAKKQNKTAVIDQLREAERLAPDWPNPHLQLVSLLRDSDPEGALRECNIVQRLIGDSRIHEECTKLAARSARGTSTSSAYPSEITLDVASERPADSGGPGIASISGQSGNPASPSSGTDQATLTSIQLFGRGSAFFLQQDYKRAATYYQLALDLEKQKPQLPHDRWRVLIDNLAMAYGIPGDLRRAQDTLEYGISKDPKYPNFYYTLACIYAEKNDLNQAISNLKTAFRYRANVIAGERMPDPRTDDSFQRFNDNPKFQRAVADLPTD